ncbi:PLD nuclease N-terminal domain-containing protein [Rhodococcus sp. 06-1460-1B]|uniref:PLD nuclease N-terminal domain-containing protein n=1 Tax=Rhodococcus sp. 06-1460-1B TaxID=2022501 RepID=UPI000B9A3CB1|nr:hypothetical protein CH268_23530 [Rhodococcus sp. 06-1460-1B]
MQCARPGTGCPRTCPSAAVNVPRDPSWLSAGAQENDARCAEAEAEEGISERRRRGIVVLGTVQLAMALAAWLDLALRSSRQVSGSKRLWAAVICVNFFGPIAYFFFGRRSDPLQ